MFFTDKKRKKNLIFSLFALAFFCGLIFLAGSHETLASAGDVAAYPFKILLYMVFVFLGWMTSVAVTLFGWYTDPATMELLNRSSVYEMWQFIRDFFNLFFILVLLYIAFTVVFQINKDFKKTILSLVLAALYINFSFPITRFLIDATNVPMYFFANQMLVDPSKPGESLGTALKASQLKEILIPQSMSINIYNQDENSITMSRLLTAVIFLFLFSVTLLVLAILFANRVIFLIILLIFSPIGFAAYVVPGMSAWSKKWWEHFWKNAIFGPAAMLGLLIATRFFTEISRDQTFGMIKNVATQTSTASDMNFIASMTMFVIPIIMLWMVMALGNTMSIAGASGLISMGQNFSKWAGKAPFRATWAGMKWGGRKLDTHVLAKHGLSPKAWIGGIKGYFETQEHEDKRSIDLAKGRVHNKMNKAMAVLPWVHEDKVNREFLIQQGHIQEEEKELKDRSGGTINEDTGRVGLREAKAEHDGAKVVGSMATLAKTNGLDNVVGDHWKDYIERNADGSLAKKADGTWKSKQRDGKDIIKSRLENGKVKVSKTENFNAVFKEMMIDSGVTDEETQARHLYNVGEVAKANGDFSYSDRAQLDMASGRFRVREEEVERPDATIRQIHKLEPQAITRMAHGRTIADQDVVVNESVVLGIDSKKDAAAEKTEWGDAHKLAVQFIVRANANIVDQANRIKPEFATALQSMWEKANSSDEKVREEVKEFIAAYNGENANGRKLVQKLLGKEIKASGADPGKIPPIGSSGTSSGGGPAAATSGGVIWTPTSSGGGPRP